MEYNEGLGSIRTKKAPKKTGIGYKVFYQKDGKLYPPMVANPGGVDTPIGVWLDADAAPIVGTSKTGRPQVKNGGKGTQGGSGTLAYRPGWHLGLIPYAIQFNRKDENGEKTLFPKDFVWAEVEYAADKNYQKEAEAEGYTENGKYRHSYAGLKHLPTDGYYIYRTNPNPDTDPWIITGAMKVNRILTDKEVDDLVRKAGREPQRREQESISYVLSGLGMSVHHNSPYLLKRADGSFIDPETGERLGFDHRFMSSGEGHQAHGWGSYFSVEDLKKYGENKSLRKDVYYVKYKGILYSDKDKDGEKYVIAYDLIQKEGTTSKAKSEAKRFKDKAVDNEVESFWDDVIDILSNSKKSDFEKAEGGHHYHVEIPDNDGTNYIEEDKKLSKKVLNKVVKEFERMGWKYSNTKGGIYLDSPDGDDTLAINPLDNGRILYEKISSLNDFSPKKASELLHDAGFVGIHYFGNQDGECYVIFDENDAKIVGHDLFGLEDMSLEGLGSRLYGGVEQTSANTYRMLGRLKSDCDYYLGNGNRYAGHLYHHNEVLQIKDMIEIWDSIPDDKKPEWLTIDQLEKYSVELTGKTIEEFKKEYMSDDISEAEKEKLRSYKGKGGQKNTTDRGILDEFYTPEYVCEFMYQLAVKYGYKCGKVLEPSIAIGNCIRPIYERNDYTHIDAFEINETSREICKKLYPNVTIYPNYFETAFLEPPRFSTKAKKTWLPNAPYDLAIGNPPYGKHVNRYSSYFTGKDKFAQTEMFFIYESLKLLRPGGLLVFITSTNFMSTGNAYQQAKERIEEIADLVDAYRLPKVFDKTDICTDIIVLRKK